MHITSIHTDSPFSLSFTITDGLLVTTWANFDDKALKKQFPNLFVRPAWPFCGPIALLCRDVVREEKEKREFNETARDSGQANKVGFAWDDEQEKGSNASEAWITLVQVINAWHEKEEEEDNVGSMTKIFLPQSISCHLKCIKTSTKRSRWRYVCLLF